MQHPATSMLDQVSTSSRQQVEKTIFASRSTPFDETSLPEEVKTLVAESSLLTELRQFEYRLDQLIAEKKHRIRQLLTNTTKTEKYLLRIYIFHDTYKIEPNKYAVTMRIQGHLHDIVTGEILVKDNLPKFSRMVKRVVIQLDREYFPGGGDLIEWDSHTDFADCAGFCIKRTAVVDPAKYASANPSVPDGNANSVQQQQQQQQLTSVNTSAQGAAAGVGSVQRHVPRAKLLFQLKHDVPMYHPTHTLFRILSSAPIDLFRGPNEKPPAQTLDTILTGVWNYVKDHNLQDANDSNLINNDAVMREVFGTDRMSFADILTRIRAHLILPDPVEVDYNIYLNDSMERKSHLSPVDVEYVITQQRDILAVDKLKEKEIEQLNMDMLKTLDNVRAHKIRREFMIAFAASPVEFIHKQIASQTRDLLTMARQQHLEELRRAPYYQAPAIKEAVQRIFQKAGGGM